MGDRKKLVVLTGAGISAESGIPTFRDVGGIWQEYDVTEVASPEGWAANPGLVLEFYNQRRRQLLEVEPNAAHFALADLEKRFDVVVITQNVDDLHERAGSRQVIHLHGELLKSRSTSDSRLVYDCRGDILLGDHCELGSQLRPHIVWFGEPVPNMEIAAEQAAGADGLLIIGSSLQVYPAAGLFHFARPEIPLFYVDPDIDPDNDLIRSRQVEAIPERATAGVPPLVDRLLRLEFP